MIWEQDAVTIADPDQVVLEFEPYRRLAYTWHSVTAEFAEQFGFGDEFLARVSDERRSKVTFDIESLEQTVKLTVVHDEFEPGSPMLDGIRGGWPAILSNLKTLLETGETLPASPDTARQDETGPGDARRLDQPLRQTSR